MLKNSIILFFSLLLFPFLAYSSDVLIDLVGEETAKELIAEGSLTCSAKKDSLLLIPEYPFVRVLTDRLLEELHPNLVVETLNLFKKPSGISQGTWTDEEKLALLNGTLSLSKLKGIEYYSKSKGKMRVLYEESVVIDGPESKKEIPDPVLSLLPDSLTIFVKQKDTTFGENIYRYDYYSTPGALVFVQQNLTSMTYGLLPLVGKNKLRSVVAVVDAGEYLVVYGLSMAKASAPSWMEKRVKESFSNRANAVMKWFRQLTVTSHQ
ncbi:MAG: hypothetical protein LIO93_01590 [Bacteroidales bacterium]|nr:hypothetical protein [Bacteroidales bacterium]